MDDDMHIKLHNQVINLIDMKLYAQNQLYILFSFWDLKVLIASLGMPDSAHLNTHNQSVAVIDMYIDAKNSLFASNSFWDIKV